MSGPCTFLFNRSDKWQKEDPGGFPLDSGGFGFALTLKISEKQNCKRDKGLTIYILLGVYRNNWSQATLYEHSLYSFATLPRIA